MRHAAGWMDAGRPGRTAAAGRGAGGAVAVALVTCAALAGCGGTDADGGAGGVGPDVPERAASETLSLGELDGPEAYTYGRVTGLALDEGGQIYVADDQASAVRVYDAAGEHLQTVGRHGQGPGELDGPCCLTVDARGRLWVREVGNNRYSVFQAGDDGTVAFVDGRRMQHGAGGLWAPVHVVGDSVVDVGAEFGSHGRLRWMVGPEASVRELPSVPGREPEEIGSGLTVARNVEGGRAIFYFQRPFGPRHLMAFGPGGAWADVVSSRYHVVIHPDAGDSVVVEGPVDTGPELSAAERETARERIEQGRERAASDADRLDFEVPERKQPLGDLFFDEEGRLWVELSVADGAPRRADLYGLDGTLLERRTWSGDVDISLPGWVGRDSALGVRTDSLGVQRVVRLEWSAGG